MIRVLIEDEQINSRSGNKDGAVWTRREQSAYIGNGHAHPARFVINLRDNEKPYPPGTYYLSPKSFVIGQYNDLNIGRYIVLDPASDKK